MSLEQYNSLMSSMLNQQHTVTLPMNFLWKCNMEYTLYP